MRFKKIQYRKKITLVNQITVFSLPLEIKQKLTSEIYHNLFNQYHLTDIYRIKGSRIWNNLNRLVHIYSTLVYQNQDMHRFQILKTSIYLTSHINCIRILYRFCFLFMQKKNDQSMRPGKVIWLKTFQTDDAHIS